MNTMTVLFLLFLLLKVSALLVAALVAARATRRMASAIGHRIWSITFLALVAMPLLSVTLPAVHVPMPGWTTGSISRIASSAKPASTVVQVAPIGAPSVVPAPTVQPMSSGREMPAFRLPTVRVVLLVAWAAGAAAALAALIVSLAGVRRLAASGVELDDEDWRLARNRIASRLGLRRKIRVLASSAVETPMAGGIVRFTVFVPSEATSWNAELREIVLAHEIAHLINGDPLRHLVSRIAFAFYWFHPLMWLASRRAAAVRESACDEVVLALGVRPSTYARVLLAFADVPSPRFVGAALPIAGHAFEARLMAILADSARRSSSRRALTAFPIIGIVALTLSIAAVQPSPSASRMRLPASGIQSPVQRPILRDQIRFTRVPASHTQSVRPQPRRVVDNESASRDSARNAAPMRIPPAPIDTARIHLPPVGPVSTDSPFDVLFSGIALTQQQATQAHALLDSLQAAQLTQTTNTMKRRQEVMSMHPALQAHLDSALLVLPTNATDVATLRSRLTQALPGDGLYSRLFDGIAMSSDQEAAARAAIVEFQQNTRALMPPPEPPILGIRRNPTRVMLRPASDSAVRALLSSDADRATLQSRINVVNPPPRPPN